MQTGFYSNTGAMVTQFNRLDVISNNLANLNTSGFKRDDVVIGDFMRLYKEKRDMLPIDNHTKEGSKFLNRSLVRVPQIVEEYTEQKLGNVVKTDNPLDFSLQEENMFFAVQTPSGIKYTRDGSFSLDENGRVVNKLGFPILSSTNTPIEIPQGREVVVTSEGSVYATNEERLNEDTLLTSLMIVRFDNPKWLKKEGDNIFTTDKIPNQAQAQNLVAQGFLEKSNVNAVREMTYLIETNRLVGMYQKVMDTQMNEINNDAITKLGALRG